MKKFKTATLHTERTFLKKIVRVHMWKGAEFGLTNLSSFCHLLTPGLRVKLACPGKWKSFARNVNKKHQLFSLYSHATSVNINWIQRNKCRTEMRKRKIKRKGQGQEKKKEKGKEFWYSNINLQSWNLKTELYLQCPWLKQSWAPLIFPCLSPGALPAQPWKHSYSPKIFHVHFTGNTY